MGFLFTKRWLGFLVVVLALAFLAWRLGEWQFHRLDERRVSNAHVRTNVQDSPVPVADVLSTERQPERSQEWLPVTINGTWDDERTVVIRYQTRSGGPGVDVVTPLVTADGTAVAVDRGWMPAQNSGSKRPDVPAATNGEVTVTGYVRIDGTGGSTVIDDLSARAISGTELAKVTPYPVYRGFVMLTDQAPKAASPLEGPELPELDDGPHFFYGLQWWFFAALAIGGFGYLAWDERRRRRDEQAPAGESSDGDTGADTGADSETEPVSRS